MFDGTTKINLEDEMQGLIDDLDKGDPCASVHLARLIEADTQGVFRPFAEVLAARLGDHLKRYAELGVSDPEMTLTDEVYHLLQMAAVDWDGLPCNGRPGEEV
jgi:hypothetical protein